MYRGRTSRFPHAGHFMSSAMSARRRQPHAAGRLATSRSDPSPPPGPQPPRNLGGVCAPHSLENPSTERAPRNRPTAFQVHQNQDSRFDPWLSTPVNLRSTGHRGRFQVRPLAFNACEPSINRAPREIPGSTPGFQRVNASINRAPPPRRWTSSAVRPLAFNACEPSINRAPREIRRGSTRCWLSTPVNLRSTGHRGRFRFDLARVSVNACEPSINRAPKKFSLRSKTEKSGRLGLSLAPHTRGRRARASTFGAHDPSGSTHPRVSTARRPSLPIRAPRPRPTHRVVSALRALTTTQHEKRGTSQTDVFRYRDQHGGGPESQRQRTIDERLLRGGRGVGGDEQGALREAQGEPPEVQGPGHRGEAPSKCVNLERQLSPRSSSSWSPPPPPASASATGTTTRVRREWRRRFASSNLARLASASATVDKLDDQLPDCARRLSSARRVSSPRRTAAGREGVCVRRRACGRRRRWSAAVARTNVHTERRGGARGGDSGGGGVRGLDVNPMKREQ